MAYTSYDQYLENEIMSADPMKLVRILYRAAIEATASARHHLRTGAIRERSRQISRASGILNELAQSLDHQQGGEISRTLAELYAYMQTRLMEANSRQMDAPLEEVEKLLSTLLEAWCEMPSSSPPRAKHTYEPVSGLG